MGGNLYGRATRVGLKDLGGELALTCPKLARSGVKRSPRLYARQHCDHMTTRPVAHESEWEGLPFTWQRALSATKANGSPCHFAIDLLTY